MSQQLVISAIGTDRPGIVNTLSQFMVEHNGNIDDSRMTVLGGEFAFIMLISAAADDLEQIENNLAQVAKKLDLKVISKRTGKLASEQKHFTYFVEVLSIDHPGIVYQLADFFSAHNINIQSLQTDRYPAAHTGTLMFSMEMIISIPQSVNVAAIREQFLELCESMNLDASIKASRV